MEMCSADAHKGGRDAEGRDALPLGEVCAGNSRVLPRRTLGHSCHGDMVEHAHGM